jgi:hypothetical protein
MGNGFEARHDRATGADLTRMAVGLIWVAGALFNAIVTLRVAQPYEAFAEDAHLWPYRWFFSIVSDHPQFWTVLLIIGELLLGLLTLSKGIWAKLGLLGSVGWSLWLFPLLWPYTLMMGLCALVPLWLLRRSHDVSLVDLVRRRIVLTTMHEHTFGESAPGREESQ